MEPEAVPAVGREPHGSADDADVIDFSANTNPIVPDGVETVYREAFASALRYPEEPPTAYREAAGAYVGCPSDTVVPTPGGLAAIRLAIETTVGADDSVLVPAPSFGEYAREVRLQGATPEFVDHRAVLEADPADHALAVVCHPNNPTGEAYRADDLRAFVARCREVGTPVLIDEAFLGFTDHPSLAGTDGAIVARALTKLFGLPGLRMGFAAATGERLRALRAARRTWNLGGPALRVGEYCMRQDDFVVATRGRVRDERARMRETLTERPMVERVFPSDAPYLLIELDADVDAVVAGLRDRGLVVRDARSFRGLDSHIRVAVRRPAENDRLLGAMADVG